MKLLRYIPLKHTHTHTIMSLGFNPNRKHRATTLPGGVNSALMPPPPPRRTSLARRRSPSGSLAPSVPPVTLASVSKPAPQPMLAKKEEEDDDESHWVYATVDTSLRSLEDDSVVASTGQRVLLVYPMADRENDGVVSMRLKAVHPVTGQLSYTWVAVYDSNTKLRSVSNFALVP